MHVRTRSTSLVVSVGRHGSKSTTLEETSATGSEAACRLPAPGQLPATHPDQSTGSDQAGMLRAAVHGQLDSLTQRRRAGRPVLANLYRQVDLDAHSNLPVDNSRFVTAKLMT